MTSIPKVSGGGSINSRLSSFKFSWLLDRVDHFLLDRAVVDLICDLSATDASEGWKLVLSTRIAISVVKLAVCSQWNTELRASLECFGANTATHI